MKLINQQGEDLQVKMSKNELQDLLMIAHEFSFDANGPTQGKCRHYAEEMANILGLRFI